MREQTVRVTREVQDASSGRKQRGLERFGLLCFWLPIHIHLVISFCSPISQDRNIRKICPAVAAGSFAAIIRTCWQWETAPAFAEPAVICAGIRQK